MAEISPYANNTNIIDWLLKKRRKDQTWPLQANHPVQLHFDMEVVGKSSRWNTLRALRVLKHFEINTSSGKDPFME